jgi:glucose uptake protein GlcU
MTKENPWKFIIKGTISALLYGVTLILIPLLIFYAAETYAVSYFPITPEMKFYVVAMGMVVIAFAFGRESSPKRSVRRVIFNTLLTLGNMFYIYSYWLSGVANLDLSLPIMAGTEIGIHLNLGTLLAIELGVIGLKIIILIYDLIDAIVYMSKRKTKINVNPGEAESDTFAAYLEEDGGK